jgi:hypothetical protein
VGDRDVPADQGGDLAAVGLGGGRVAGESVDDHAEGPVPLHLAGPAAAHDQTMGLGKRDGGVGEGGLADAGLTFEHDEGAGAATGRFDRAAQQA